jgi:hypothetical protein
MTNSIQPIVFSILIVLGLAVSMLVCIERPGYTPSTTKLLTLLTVVFVLLLPVAVVCWKLGL